MNNKRLEEALTDIDYKLIILEDHLHGEDGTTVTQIRKQLARIINSEWKSEELNESAEEYFDKYCQTFRGMNAGEYLDKEDFLKFARGEQNVENWIPEEYEVCGQNCGCASRDQCYLYQFKSK